MQQETTAQCACGCGTTFNLFDTRGRPRRFVRNHKPRPPVADRFWTKIVCDLTTGCWIWIAARNGVGRYGQLHVRDENIGRREQAHRVSWELHFGRIPDDKWVLHRCDVMGCVRPDHLFLGDRVDNIHDMFAKNRGRPGWMPGSRNGASKLSETDVLALRGKAATTTYADLGREFGISATMARSIVLRHTWRHI